MNDKKTLFITLLIAMAIAGSYLLWPHQAITPVLTRSTVMKLESQAFADGAAIPAQYSCDGSGVSPELKISGAPADAKSLALIMHDPDTKSDFVHWTFWNADSDTTVVKEGEPPMGAVLGRNGADKAGYIGPCPPSGTHRYVFELFALDGMLDIAPTTDAAALRAAMQGHVLDTTTLTGTYAHK